MTNIHWENGAVCYGDGRQWFANTDYESDKLELVNNDGTRKYSIYGILNFTKDFQLNEIREGDFIPASELDTEQKYNDAVEVLKLYGVTGGLINRSYQVASALNDGNDERFVIHKTSDGELCFGVVPSDSSDFCKRKLTYDKAISIGKLKRMMLECENIERQSSYCRCKQVALSVDDKPNHSESHKTSIDYLTECVEVQKQRGEQYDQTGTGERSFDAAAKAYNSLTGGNLKGSDVCLILTCVKAVRQYSNPERLHEDSLLDLVSYASLWAEELNKELK